MIILKAVFFLMLWICASLILFMIASQTARDLGRIGLSVQLGDYAVFAWKLLAALTALAMILFPFVGAL